LPIKDLNHEGNNLATISFSSDESYMVSATDNGSINIWNLIDLKEKPYGKIGSGDVDQGTLKDIAFIPKTKHFISVGDSSDSLKVWDIDGKEQDQDEAPATPNNFNNNLIKVDKEGRYLVSYLEDETKSPSKKIKTWDIKGSNLSDQTDTELPSESTGEPPNSLKSLDILSLEQGGSDSSLGKFIVLTTNSEGDARLWVRDNDKTLRSISFDEKSKTSLKNVKYAELNQDNKILKLLIGYNNNNIKSLKIEKNKKPLVMIKTKKHGY
jgi:WD40 repeat protein